MRQYSPFQILSVSPIDRSLIPFSCAFEVAQERFVLGEPKLAHLHEQAVKKLKEGIERDGE